jgi:glycosyltransferase involved in cell wall biosynthesis
VVWHLREILPAGRRRRWFARRLERDADRIVAVSDAVASWVRAEGVGRPLDVIHNGIAPSGDLPSKEGARAELGLETSGVLVGLFGQILPHKGVLDLVEAAAATLRASPDARFVIAGDGPESYVRQVDRAIAATGRSAEIKRLPSRADPSILFAAADVIALTTRTPDPLPRAVLEGLAAGRPVVAYRSGGVPEMVDEGQSGLLVDTGDVAGLTHALTSLVTDAARRDEMGRRAAASASARFGVERHVDRMEQLFEELRSVP